MDSKFSDQSDLIAIFQAGEATTFPKVSLPVVVVKTLGGWPMMSISETSSRQSQIRQRLIHVNRLDCYRF